ncbi:SDR family oxidoreductase [Pseudoroseomonas wenyumeiae]|uniref:SDR family oxidoreductase n=1 Tax=Teichococcus wenyumeiae TaxID=2478470 RepID=A0A3A9K3H6_9PROT|nr:SDR family NAD(P)-dependent oxidoreductase [Pseudoroseomonas wenyumeiae]RKK05929.1 SDR family oxidoreductase [Pseudoroseomonas wenyumeiae]RMI19847.1 SDR family oxidoreductase [Pseudoroseomonas wenyumeiae]
MAERKRVALVTGAARGIGYGIAGRLARDGAHVVITDVLDSVAGSAAALRAEGGSVEGIAGDVSDEAWVAALARQMEERHGGVDILVNNAGISPKRDGGKILVRDTTWAEWQQVIAINLGGAFLMCRAFVPGMQARGWGRVVTISSQAARTRADIAGAAYAASKAGLVAFSRVLASEAGRQGVTVNCIAPGRIESPMQAVAGEEATREYVTRIPVGRIGTAADIAATVAFLASEEAGFITGATLDVNGGFFMG